MFTRLALLGLLTGLISSCQSGLIYHLYNRSDSKITIILPVQHPDYAGAQREQIIEPGDFLKIFHRSSDGMKINYKKSIWTYPAIPFPWKFKNVEKWRLFSPDYYVPLSFRADGYIYIDGVDGEYRDPHYPFPSFPIKPRELNSAAK